MEKGTIFKFHNDLDTDQIIASQYLLLPTIEEMKVHTFESLDPEFPQKVKPGDYVVGGENFGCGSSREQAPSVLKALGVQAVVAKSFARIFYRNAINIGLPAKQSAGISSAVGMLPAASLTKPMTGVTIPPPIMVITMKDEPYLVSWPRFLMPSEKIVGY